MERKNYIKPEICVFVCEAHQMIAATELRTNGQTWKDGFEEEPGFDVWVEDPAASSSGSTRMSVWDAPLQVLWEEELLY